MQIHCTQCGASINLEEGSRFLTCPFCGSALYVDKTRIVFHFVITPIITTEEAQGKLRRWMAGNETVKDLDVHAVIQGQELTYFPMWRFVVHQDSGEREYNEPATSFSIPEIKTIPLSGGDLKFFSPQEFRDIPLKEPDVLLESAVHWVEGRGVKRDQIRETNLIHLPFYTFKYEFKGKQYQAIVDGTSGRVLAAIFPAKDEIPFIGIAVASAIAFFVEGLIAPGFGIRVLLYLATALPLGLLSYTVVRKF
jgi:hypothetical protein